MPDDLHLAYLKCYGLKLNEKIEKLHSFKNWAFTAPSEVGLSRIVSSQNAKFVKGVIACLSPVAMFSIYVKTIL